MLNIPNEIFRDKSSTVMSAEGRSEVDWQGFRSSKKFIYVVVNLAAFTDAYVYGLIVPILPYALTRHANVPPADVQKWTGILLGAFGAGLFVASPIAGYWADNTVSRRTPYLTGLIALTASTVMYSLGSQVVILVIARLVQGASSGFVYCTGVVRIALTKMSERSRTDLLSGDTCRYRWRYWSGACHGHHLSLDCVRVICRYGSSSVY